MAKVDPTSLVLNRLLEGLERPITEAENRALRSAIEALPEKALVTTIAIDSLALPHALESALIFRLFARAHPSQTSAHLHVSKNLAAVMRSIFEAEPSLVKDFLARLEIDPEKDLSGVRFDAPVKSLEVSKVDGENGRLELSVTLRGDARPRSLSIDSSWTFAFGGEKPRPLADLDLTALAELKKHLEARAEGGARDPLLNLLRGSVAERSGGLLKEAVQEIDRLHREKRNARLEHLRQIDEALRLLLGAASVGETDKGTIDDMAAGLYPREKD